MVTLVGNKANTKEKERPMKHNRRENNMEQEKMQQEYDHYIAVDWSKKNMAIARMTKKSNKITAIDVPADIKELQLYLSQLKGAKILAIEETTTSQWLYTELVDLVEKLFVCDPYRNRLLSEGPKTDKIDASKLVQLLRANLMKEVYHSSHEFVNMRRLVSGYNDLVKAGVQLKNQRHALIRAVGKDSKSKVQMEHELEQFVLENIEKQIQVYEEDKKRYEKTFKKLGKKHKEIRHQKSLPGINWINAIKIVARVTTPYRFPEKGNYLSYCGLVKLDKKSGGKSYGRKESRYSRELKYVYKTAAQAAIGGNNFLNGYFEYLLREKRYSEKQARNAVARRVAILSWGVFKSGKKYQLYRRETVTGNRV